MKRPAGAPSKVTPSAKQVRADELRQCEYELNQLLSRYEAALVVTQIMQLSADGSPRYQFRVDIMPRS